MKNQIEQTNFIKEKFSKYLHSTFDIRDDQYRKLYKERLEELESKLYKGPYLASSLPFEPSKTLNELVFDGVFVEDFKKIGGKDKNKEDYLDFDRPCYAHQIKAFDCIRNNRNMVVTTGTGSGKTECFMFPIINELIKECNEGNIRPGVRAIFLFPLNALVYDQMDRLRGLLQNYEDIRFGFYTGKTPEDDKTPEGRRQLEVYRKKYGEPSRNEVLTREKMRENPPQILFTNYSMLEYLLIRPTDQSLISKDALKNLRFVVLDEAHIYRGALGIEIALLLRRLQGTADRKPQFVLTSATLGKGKEDLDKIISFAENLTSASFEEEDIIFGIRHEHNMPIEYRIEPLDYVNLLTNIENTSKFIEIYEKYRKYDSESSIKVNIFELLIRDENTKNLYHYTKNVGGFFDVKGNMYDFSDEALTALVDLVTKAISSDSKFALKLFDIKYHMFMKAPDGAFITLGKEGKDLSLVTVNNINGKKAFKIGICQNCKVPYIMGITENNMLCIDDEIDIDESYADKARRLEYYLIEDSLTSEEKEDIENDPHFEKYYICTICGYLRSAKSAISTKDCEHFERDKAIIYKYIGNEELDLDDEDIVTNNLHRCPVCDYKSNAGGVIMGFHVGKDRATTLIAQILYESMEYPTRREKASVHSLFNKQDKIIKLKKQFLAFSDSRQQAAFFSKFLNSNNDRFLKKAMIWNVLEENDHNEISYTSLVSKLEGVFRHKLNYPSDEAIKHAKAAALWELHLTDGRNSGEGIGLFAFKLNLNEGNYADEVRLEEALHSKGFTNLTARQFKDMTAHVLTVFRTSPAIEYEALAVDDVEQSKELLGYRHRKVYISLQKKRNEGQGDKYYPVRSFLPIEDDATKKSSINNAVKYVMKALGYDVAKAKELLQIIFLLAFDEKIILDNPDKKYPNTFLIDSTKFDLYSYKNLNFYKCKKCNKLTLYNVNNKCTEADCDGELEFCDVDNEQIIANNYYRNEYIARPIERLVCKEHTAQLNADEAKAIQEDFKNENGETNFISCSTTFEMGIDLGGLNTVFMRNVPPMPSNYAQRAGRAGRRADTSAYILTFCGTSSHDYSYFIEPKEMIKGLVDPPYFVIDNEKIIMRHITATALSLFFREPKHQIDFDSIDHFIQEDVKTKFLTFIKSKPIALGEMVDKFVLQDSTLVSKYGNFKWVDMLEESESALNSMCEGVSSLMKIYKEASDAAWHERRASEGKSYDEALRRMNTKNSLITYFTKYNVIPGYGFPVDNVELHIYNHANQDMSDEYNLSRDLSQALSEYAPGSEVIVDDKKYTSRYLFLPHNNYSLPKTYYCECDRCHTKNVNIDKSFFVPGCQCKYCGTPLNTSGKNVKSYITPIYGFVADKKNKDTKRVKPFKTYASDIFYVGDGVANEKEIVETIEVNEYENEELLVLNENNFYFCPICGYTDLDKRNQLETKIVQHNEYRGKKCTTCGGRLNLTHLGYSYRTDVVRITFNDIHEMNDKDTAISVLFALLEGISRAYDIERNDIGGLVYSANPTKSYELILFDTVSGGAGHVKRLKNSDSLMEVLKCALKKVSQDCCAEDTSCYNCLRTYGNQRLHKHIKRGLAKNALCTIINTINTKKQQYSIVSVGLKITSNEIAYNVGEYISEVESKTAFFNLMKEIEMQQADHPSSYGCVLSLKNNDEKQYADFLWDDKRILLFSLDNKKSYEKMVSDQVKYKCYLLTDSFDYVSFVKEVVE